MNIILGIDPGSQLTGYGIIRSNGQKHAYIASGTIVVRGQEMTLRLANIFRSITEIIARYNPNDSAIEQVFMAQNPSSALKLGQARGAAIAALANQGLTIAEYSPRSVKQAIVGYGAANKEQVQHMIKLLLSLNEAPPADAADALAIAICHAQTQHTNAIIQRQQTTLVGALT